MCCKTAVIWSVDVRSYNQIVSPYILSFLAQQSLSSDEDSILFLVGLLVLII